MALAASPGGADSGGTGGGGPGLMDKAELKPLLLLSRRRPVSCAVMLTKDKQGAVLLDKKMKPRKLAATLRSKAKAAGLELDPSTVRFGRASVDGASDSAWVVFRVHKDAPAAMGRAMLPLLRPVGFQRCEFVTDAALENEPEDGEDGEDKADKALPAPGITAASAPGPATPAAASPPHASSPRAPLAAVVPPDVAEGIRAAMAADPSRKPELLRLLAQARAGVETGDPGAAGRGMAALRQALDGPAPAQDGRTASNRETDAARPVPVSPAPAAEPRPLQANAKLAGLAQAWSAQQGQDGLAGPAGAARQSGPATPAPLAFKSPAPAARPGGAGLTAPGEDAAPLPFDGSEGLLTPALFQEPSAAPEVRPPPPVEPVPASRPPTIPGGPAPSVRPPGVPPPVEGVPPAMRIIGTVAIAVVGGIVANQLNSASFDSQVVDALKRFGLDPSKPADVKAAQAYTYMRIVAPVRFQFWSVPSSDPGNGRVAEAVLRAVQADPDLLDRAVAQEQGAVDRLEAVIQGALGGAAAVPSSGQAIPPTMDPTRDGSGTEGGPPRPGTPGLPQAPPPGQEVQPPAWLKEIEGIEARDEEEREFINGLAMGGMRHNDIVNALNERRRTGGAAPGSGPPGGAARPPVSAGPHSPPGPPYPGPDVTPMDRQERALVQDLLNQGKDEDDIRQALAERRATEKAEQDKRMSKEGRNRGLPSELSTDRFRYRDNAIDADPAVQTGELTREGNPKLKIRRDDIAVHHLWAMETIRNHPALFAAAARAGWNPDEGDNTFVAAKNKEAQQRMEETMGERRPVHDNGHNIGSGSWNAKNDADAVMIEKELDGLNLPPGPERDQEARRLIEEHQKLLREQARKLDRITMLPGAAQTEAA